MTDHCEKCNAEVINATAGDEQIPLNATPAAGFPIGQLYTLDGNVAAAVDRGAHGELPAEGGPFYTSHVVTCPDPSAFKAGQPA